MAISDSLLDSIARTCRTSRRPSCEPRARRRRQPDRGRERTRTAPKRAVDRQIAECTLATEIIELLRLRTIPDAVPAFDGDLSDDDAIEQFALDVRAAAQLSEDDVVGNAIRAAERLGCLVLPIREELGRHLGLSARANLTPVICVSRPSVDRERDVPGDRQRFTVAHESGTSLSTAGWDHHKPQRRRGTSKGRPTVSLGRFWLLGTSCSKNWLSRGPCHASHACEHQRALGYRDQGSRHAGSALSALSMLSKPGASTSRFLLEAGTGANQCQSETSTQSGCERQSISTQSVSLTRFRSQLMQSGSDEPTLIAGPTGARREPTANRQTLSNSPRARLDRGVRVHAWR